MSQTPTTKIIAIDDDPTGSQTVHSCLLLTRWDQDTLREALIDDSPLFFVLSNTRGMSAGEAASITREICVNLRATLARLNDEGTVIQPVLVSRSDSTLRGHYPVETDIIGRGVRPLRCPFPGAGLFRGRAHHPRRRALSDDGWRARAGERDRIRARLGVRVQPCLPARLCGGEDRRAHPRRIRSNASDWRTFGATSASVCAICATTAAAWSMPSLSPTSTASPARCSRRRARASAFCSAARPVC